MKLEPTAVDLVSAFDPLRTLNGDATKGLLRGAWVRPYIHFTIRLLLIGVQLAVAAFYASVAVVMWGPFMAGPAWAKAIAFTLVAWPALALIVASRNARMFSLGVTSIIALLTAIQLLIVFTIAVVA